MFVTIWLSFKKTSISALTCDHAKNVFVFDEDIDVYDPTDVLWASATRVQPHRQVSDLVAQVRDGGRVFLSRNNFRVGRDGITL